MRTFFAKCVSAYGGAHLMAELVWTTQAKRALRDLAEYRARTSPHYAERIVDRIYQASTRLELFPPSGRQVPEIEDEDIREIVVDGYRLFYLFLVDEDRVEIVTLRHSSQQFGA